MAAVEAAVIEEGSAVADVGFGGGVALPLLLAQVGESGVVHGIEVSETMLAGAGRRFQRQLASGRLQLHEAPMQRLPLRDGSLDAVISTNTIYFITDIEVVIAELARVLRPGGRLALGVGDPDSMARRSFLKHGFTLRPLTLINDYVRDAGFADVQDVRLDGKDAPHVIVGARAD